MNKSFIAGYAFVLAFLFSCRTTIANKPEDYALLEHKDDWSHHYAFGSPSWDGFERFEGNPVYEGRKGMEWPVNGFLFSDPVSKQWYLYIGEYRENYLLENNTGRKDLNCAIYASADRGKTWTKKSDLFGLNTKAYGGLNIEAPDVMVIYADGKYHMIFDWVPANATWGNTDTSGLGYAVADKPEGPFVISEKPLKINTAYKSNPKVGKYARMYAPMIIKRKNDWAILHMFDTQPARAWCLAVATSSQPEGPYSDSKIVLNVEAPNNHPPLQEFYPAFMHDGYVYFPATSVAINRNYQSVYRVKIEELTDSSKYELFSSGSFFHGTQDAHEYAGIWGQTFTGFVQDDSLYIMYPSKNKINYGTINLAKASWSHFFREKGFRLSSHEEKSFTYIKKAVSFKGLTTNFSAQGTVHFMWDFNAPLDISDGWGKFSLHDVKPDYKEVVVNKNGWKVTVYDGSASPIVSDSGLISKWNDSNNQLVIEKQSDEFVLKINNEQCWHGNVKTKPGIVGIALDPHGYISVDQFELNSSQVEGSVTYGFYEALLSAGNQDSAWTFTHDSTFLNGRGAISRKDSAIGKWIFDGKGFEWYAPKGPAYGKVNIYLDGHLLQTIDLESSTAEKSAPRYISGKLSFGKHNVLIQSVSKKMPLDCIRVLL